MNLYSLHREPKTLHRHADRNTHVAQVFYRELVKTRAKPEEFKKREDAIAKDAMSSCDYAARILDGPFPKGEDAIAKDAHYSYLYADEVIGGPWPKGEAAMAKNAGKAYIYARNVLKGQPFPKGEDAIAKDAYYAYYYAVEVIKGPWPKGEAAMAASTRATDLSNAEAYIKKFPERKEAMAKLGFTE